MFTVFILIAGLWIGTAVVRSQFSQQAELREPHQRPHLHLVDVTREELVEAGFNPSALDLPWSNISVRLAQEASGEFVRVMACTIAPEAVSSLIKIEPGVRRPPASGPPPWWPWEQVPPESGPISPFRVPDWFQPMGAEDLIIERRIPGDQGIWEGLYVAYDRPSERLWLWQWRRHDWHPPAGLTSTVEAIDVLAQGFGAHLIAIRHPVGDGGWIQRPGQEIGRSGVPREVLPARATLVDLCIRPSGPQGNDGEQRSGRLSPAQRAAARGEHDYIIALHGVEEADLPALLRDHYLRALPDDSPPPLSRWAFARPAQMPSWFAPGPGPRWATTVVIPGSGLIRSGRWVAYDGVQQRLLIWDWARASGEAAAADIVAGRAMAMWPDDPWQLPR